MCSSHGMEVLSRNVGIALLEFRHSSLQISSVYTGVTFPGGGAPP
jgi:hypothetical protein